VQQVGQVWKLNLKITKNYVLKFKLL